MRKTFTLLIALMALCVSSWATTVTWSTTQLEGISISASNPDYSENATVDDITVNVASPTSEDYCHFDWNSSLGSSSICIRRNGKLTFSSASYNLTGIVISCDDGIETMDVSHLNLGTDWSWDNTAKTLTWSGDAAASVKLVGDGTSEQSYLGNIESIVFTVAPAGPAPTPTSVTWNAGNGLGEINLSQYTNYYFGTDGPYSFNDVNFISTSIDNVTATISASTNGDYAYFASNRIMLENNATLTFSTTTGQFKSIVITYEGNGNMNSQTDWDFDWEAKTLTWLGTPANSVVLASAYAENITSIVFTFVGTTPIDPTPSGPSFTWNTQQINLVSLSCDNSNKNAENGLINNIISSLTQTRDRSQDQASYEYCQITSGQVLISNSCGDLKFKSIAGDLTGIVITCNYVSDATDLSANWSYNGPARTITWSGTSTEEVTLSGNLNFSINSVEFFYSPAAAPRMGEEFCDDWQWYEITGAHTAKVTGPRNLGGSINIPASVEDNGVIYYINEINEYAFYNRGELSNAFIGENVAIIGAHAFDGCTWMTEIRIESRVVESIGDEAFKDCLLLHGLQCYTSLPPVLGNNAFEGDTRLNHIDVYSSVVSDYQSTTNWSNYSSKITALWSNRAIGEKFFYHNQKTTGVYEVTSASPKEVKVLPYPADVNAIYPITYESTLVIPESTLYMNYGYAVTGIAANAFKNITDIKVVSIPQSVRSIEAGAFSGCTNVENVFFLWNDPKTVTWADGNVGAEFATAASGNTKIFVPEGKLAAYQAWAPKWAGCMVESAFEDVTASQDPHDVVFYRTYYNSSKDLMLPPDVWAYVGYVENEEFKLHTIAFDGEIVPAGTAVVLRSFSPEYRLIAMKPVAEPYTGTNQLRGSDVNIPRTSVGNNGENVYVLGKEAWIGGNRQEGMGLYKYTGATLGAHKAYLIYDGAGSGSSNTQHAPARFLFRHEDNTENVMNIQSDNAQCAKVLRDGQLIIIKDGKEYNAQGLIIK